MASDIDYTGSDDPYWRIECGLVQMIRDLELRGDIATDVVDAKVYPRMFPDSDTVTYPCVLVMLEGDSEGKNDDVNDQDDVEFSIAIVDRMSPKMHQRKRVFLRWRRAIRGKLRRRRDTVLALRAYESCVWNVLVSSQRMFEQIPHLPNLVFCRLTVKVQTKLARPTGA